MNQKLVRALINITIDSSYDIYELLLGIEYGDICNNDEYGSIIKLTPEEVVAIQYGLEQFYDSYFNVNYARERTYNEIMFVYNNLKPELEKARQEYLNQWHDIKYFGIDSEDIPF